MLLIAFAIITIVAVFSAYRLTSRQTAIVIPAITFEQRPFVTPDHLVRRMQADQAAHVADLARRIRQ